MLWASIIILSELSKICGAIYEVVDNGGNKPEYEVNSCPLFFKPEREYGRAWVEVK